jgi:hypothetical protein
MDADLLESSGSASGLGPSRPKCSSKKGKSRIDVWRSSAEFFSTKTFGFLIIEPCFSFILQESSIFDQAANLYKPEILNCDASPSIPEERERCKLLRIYYYLINFVIKPGIEHL